jgi:TPR repeat protein
MYYDKYLKYKNKYLQLKNQLGGLSFCEKAYKNVLGTCWAVAIQTMFTFGQATSNHLKSVIESIKRKNFIGFVKHRIGELQSNPELMNFYPDDILNGTNSIFLENIMYNFIQRYDSKLSTKESEKPKTIEYDLSNPQRCEFVIAENFKKLFVHSMVKNQQKYGGNLLNQYLFVNLLSVFFLNEKVSFENHYNNFKSINFDPKNDLGILMHLDDHVCCLYMCDGKQKYYDDNNKLVYACLWQSILKRSTNLYIKKDSNFEHIDSYVNQENLRRVDYLTVISKHQKVSALDIEIENILKRDYSNIKDRELQNILGVIFESGNHDVVENKVEAIRWLSLAAANGNENSEYNLGLIFKKNIDNEDDQIEAVRLFRLLATKGHRLAKTNLGFMLLKGRGVKMNYEEAEYWFRLAAAQESVDAQYYLGTMFEEGLGVKQNDVDALKMYILAVEQEHPKALFSAGKMLFNGGEGFEQDKVEAIRLFQHAAAKGDADAQYNLGVILLNGIDGIDIAQDNVEAIRLLRLAAAQGNVDAQFNLGLMLNNGEGVAQDNAEAERWYRLAAAQGHADAQFNLGLMLNNGEGVAQDSGEADRWYRLAAAKGHADALNFLTAIEESP